MPKTVEIEREGIEIPMTIPVHYDDHEACIMDFKGRVIYDCGRWLPPDYDVWARKRGEFLVKVLNGDVAIYKDKKTGKIKVEEWGGL